MHLMQQNGVAAGVVQNARDLLESDPQIRERGYFSQIEHPVIGTFGHPNPPFKLLKSKAQIRTSPCLGEHTAYVCTELLGMSDEEFCMLEQEGVFR
jgi:benzylsuccinate CoA-transferase BbsF subunit